MEIFQRTALLLGKPYLEKAANTRVILFGIGGVGSWCAEALIRAGIGHLTMVDSDVVSETNINRQLPATTKTVGKPKTEVLKARLLEINPNANICGLQEIYSPETAGSFALDTYDFILDAIDSLSNKVHLIQQATNTNAIFFSSMGAALKTDPTCIKVTEFWKVNGCPLAAALRSRIRKLGGTGKKFLCVYSDEIYENKGESPDSGKSAESVLGEDVTSTQINEPQRPIMTGQHWDSKKASINGTVSYMPAMFGMTIAGLVTQEIMK
ncbi:MAG: tRNA threonylcarbamoyladenosine dehydratase [Paludibacter sp.]|nr:tRNA threonylcarbamoyladenosine dehydratase [Paludibacter sp.]MDD4198693.1 tRNA threonylcarbamoyladenosine dehydratase [Paludibacter sp.]MDD4427111.1 tRNA threonylcarbamoyladenosine dehydratase [Paludibacter sp.]